MRIGGREGENVVEGEGVSVTAGDLTVSTGDGAVPPVRRLAGRPLLVLVGLTGTGKTTALDHLRGIMPRSVLLPDRRALTDQLILPMMTEGGWPVDDRLERFRLTAAFKERHPGGMGDLLGWLVLPEGLQQWPILFDGLRGAAEVAAAAAALPRARFAVLDCPPERRLLRLCGRDDPFDRVSALPGARAASPGPAAAAAETRAVLAAAGFETLVDAETVERVVAALDDAGVTPSDAGRCAAIIVEEARHYDPAAAREALLRLAPSRTLALDTVSATPAEVAAAVGRWWADRDDRA